MGRPAKKKAYWEGKMAEKGKLQAQKEAQAKQDLKTRFLSFLEVQASKIDGVELFAISGLTIVVHDAILMTDDLFGKAMDMISNIPIEFGNIFESAFGKPMLLVETPRAVKDSIWLWVISFGIAYFLMRNGGQIIGLLGNGMTNILGLMMGTLPVAAVVG